MKEEINSFELDFIIKFFFLGKSKSKMACVPIKELSKTGALNALLNRVGVILLQLLQNSFKLYSSSKAKLKGVVMPERFNSNSKRLCSWFESVLKSKTFSSKTT